MGIVSSTLATGAFRVVWICQMLLDPKYSCIEKEAEPTEPKEASSQQPQSTAQQQQTLEKTQPQQPVESTVIVTPEPASVIVVANSRTSPATSVSSVNRLPENNNSLHQQNRNRRAQQLRFGTRPSSFDAALIVRGKSKNSLVVTSSSSPLRRQNVRVWKVSSSSGCSSDSDGSNSESDSETELRVSENVSNEEGGTKLGMSAEEEAAFRLTVGRGHFTRSKKDRFLNQMRLEKRLNDLNSECFGALTCRSLQQPHHRLPLQRRHSGDLHRIM